MAPTPKGPKKIMVSAFQMVVGVDLLKSKMSMQANPRKGIILEAMSLGIIATNPAGRRVLVPWTNVKGAELMPEVEAVEEVEKPL